VPFIDWPCRVDVHGAGEAITAVFFPERGYASMLAGLDDGDSAEVGMIGLEGMIGLPLIFGTDRSLVEAMVQAEVSAVRLAAALSVCSLQGRAFQCGQLHQSPTSHLFSPLLTWWEVPSPGLDSCRMEDWRNRAKSK
jgi:hypothetical protein